MTRKILGLDWFDVVVQCGVTIVLCIGADSMFGGRGSEVATAVLLAASLVVLGYRRKQALAELPGAPVEQGRLEDLEARLAELDQVQDRVAELEERLDFTERMLGQAREQERIGRG